MESSKKGDMNWDTSDLSRQSQACTPHSQWCLWCKLSRLGRIDRMCCWWSSGSSTCTGTVARTNSRAGRNRSCRQYKCNCSCCREHIEVDIIHMILRVCLRNIHLYSLFSKILCLCLSQSIRNKSPCNMCSYQKYLNMSHNYCHIYHIYLKLC
jgi:hypothetical protein